MTEGFRTGFFCLVGFVLFGWLVLFIFTTPSWQLEINFFEDLGFSSIDLKLLFKPRIHSSSFFVSLSRAGKENVQTC